MSEENLIINSENGREDLSIKRFHVALVYVRSAKATEKSQESIEIRHQMLECQATDEAAAEWYGRKLSEKDAQMPSGFIFNSSVAMEIKL